MNTRKKCMWCHEVQEERFCDECAETLDPILNECFSNWIRDYEVFKFIQNQAEWFGQSERV